MRGALGDFIRFNILSSWNMLQLQPLEAFLHLSKLLKISRHVLIFWSLALVREVHNQLRIPLDDEALDAQGVRYP
jgi:hypothetical protein